MINSPLVRPYFRGWHWDSMDLITPHCTNSLNERHLEDIPLNAAPRHRQVLFSDSIWPSWYDETPKRGELSMAQ